MIYQYDYLNLSSKLKWIRLTWTKYARIHQYKYEVYLIYKNYR